MNQCLPNYVSLPAFLSSLPLPPASLYLNCLLLLPSSYIVSLMFLLLPNLSSTLLTSSHPRSSPNLIFLRHYFFLSLSPLHSPFHILALALSFLHFPYLFQSSANLTFLSPLPTRVCRLSSILLPSPIVFFLSSYRFSHSLTFSIRLQTPPSSPLSSVSPLFIYLYSPFIFSFSSNLSSLSLTSSMYSSANPASLPSFQAE